jgi:hypothetical protein
LKAIIKDKLNDEYAKFADDDIHNPDFCPVFVTATEAQDASGPVKLFRSYGFFRDQCPIWQVGRATSAAPSFFKEILIDTPPPGAFYIDGGLKCNNPSEIALQEAREHWKTVRRFCVVNIGTGVQKEADFIGERDLDDSDDEESPVAATNVESSKKSMGGWMKARASQLTSTTRMAVSNAWSTIGTATEKLPGVDFATRISRLPGGLKTLKAFAEELVKLSTGSEETHRRMSALANSNDPYDQFPYHRFNVPRGMEGVSLEEWRKTKKMGALTRGYLLDVQKAVANCAQELSNPTAVERT